MISVGIDIGSTTTKMVILDKEQGILAQKLVATGAVPGETADELFRTLLDSVSLTPEQIAIVATTGYGRHLVDIGDSVMTEIKACAAGVQYECMEAEPIRTIIDVGGQDTKVITLTGDGQIEDFSMNDKCAAGTGRFLEVLAQKLELSYDAFVEEALKSDTLLHMSSTCAVFAESEVVGLLARGEAKADVAAGAHDAIAGRIASMIRRTGGSSRFAFVGGGSLNGALLRAMEEHLNAEVTVPASPQLVVALGAAVVGAKKVEKRDASVSEGGG